MAANLQYSLANIPNLTHGKLLSLSGDIDESNQEVLLQILTQLLEDAQVLYVVINIKNLTYVNSGVIGLLASFHSKFIDSGKEFVFAEANDHIFDIIDLVGLTSVITVFANNDEAALSFED